MGYLALILEAAGKVVEKVRELVVRTRRCDVHRRRCRCGWRVLVPEGIQPVSSTHSCNHGNPRRSLFHHQVVKKFDRASGLPFAPLKPGNQTRLEDQRFTLYSQITLLP